MDNTTPAPDIDFDAHFSTIQKAIPVPEPIRDEVENIIETGLETELISYPNIIVDVAAALLLARRTPVVTAHRDAKEIAELIDWVGFKDILASMYRLRNSDIDTPSLESGVNDLVEALRMTANTISLPLPASNELDEWRELHGFTDTHSDNLIIARQATFTIFLRSVLLESEDSTLDPNDYTESLSNTAADSAFPDHFILDDIVASITPGTIGWIADLHQHINNADNPSDFVGECYEQLIGQENRWKLGQFRTPTRLAALMAELAIQNGDETVLAPGMGAGALAIQSLHKKTDSGCENPLSHLESVEVSELSILMGSAVIAASEFTGKPAIHNEDFFSVSPKDTADIDVVISNPPYTKHHELASDAKRSLNTQMSTEAGRSLSMLSPLYAYFTVHAVEFLSDGDSGVFLTPAEILTTQYGENWKEFLTSKCDIRAFILFDQNNESQFDEANTTSLITVVDRDDGLTTTPTDFIRVSDPAELTDITTIIGETASDGDPTTTPWGFSQSIDQDELNPSDDWDTLFDGIEHVIDEQLVPFNKIASVSRGIATGQNSFFCLSESELSGNKNGESWEIDTKFLSPVIRKASMIPNYDFRSADWEAQRENDEEAWLLYHLDQLDWDSSYYNQEISDDSSSQQQLESYAVNGGESQITESHLTDTELDLVSYLKAGMQTEDPPHETHLARNRNPWYQVEYQEPADILYTSMSRDRGRFVYNAVGARNLNNLHCINVIDDLRDDEVKALLAYLNSGFANQIIKRTGRTLSSGMDKIEPGDLADIPVIDPRTLDKSTVTTLANAFDELCAASRNGGEEQIRAELTKTLQSFLTM